MVFCCNRKKDDVITNVMGDTGMGGVGSWSNAKAVYASKVVQNKDGLQPVLFL